MQNHIPDDLALSQTGGGGPPLPLRRDDGVNYYDAIHSGQPIMVDFGDVKSEIIVDTHGYNPKAVG